MKEERMERICALLCLCSTLELRTDDLRPLSRSTVRKLLKSGALEGLSLRKRKGIASNIYDKAQKLLIRASAVCVRIEGYAAQGYQIVLEDDEQWPQRLYKLGDEMPLYLFLKGNTALMNEKTVSIAGSRSISAKTAKRAEALGCMLSSQGLTLVSGGARGVDTAAVSSALRSGGNAVVIPAVSAKEFFASAQNREACKAGKLLLVCETPPDELFSPGKALTRNHSIYAIGDLAMVVASRRGIGGSWSGAMACLKHGWSPLYILDESGNEYEGNSALIEMGAMRMQIISENGREELLLQGMNEAMLQKAFSNAAAREPQAQIVRFPIELDAIPRNETLRCLEWKGQEFDETVLEQIKEAERIVLGSIEASVVFGEFVLVEGNRLSGSSFVPEGEAAALLLDGCEEAVLMAATLGAKSERALLRMQAVDPVMAAILDAALSAAIEAVADRASEIIAVRAKRMGRMTTGRFSPGYGDMPISQSREICDVLGTAARMGLTVSSEGLMIPRKSVCAIIGKGKRVGKNTRAGCAFCAMREACKSKKAGKCTCAPVEE